MGDSSSNTTTEPTTVFEGYIVSVESDLCEVEVNGNLIDKLPSTIHIFHFAFLLSYFFFTLG